MTICPNSKCRRENRDTAKFCRYCGRRLLLGSEYRIVEVLKSGGMGAVYKARCGGQMYAVKEMTDSFTDPRERQDAINRFMAEALTLAKLDHPRIPKIYRHFIEEQRYYLAMDFVEGRDLEEVLKDNAGRGLPEAQVMHWAEQICEVLEYLHSLTPPVIFRDLKPANLMLTAQGDIMVIDFGIAKLFQPGGKGGTIIGTPGYMAMEQYQGLAEPRSDIYGLGATLHHLLTGRDPRQHNPFTFQPVRVYDATLSETTERAVGKMLEVRVEDRYSTVEEARGGLRPRLVRDADGALVPGTVLGGRYKIITQYDNKYVSAYIARETTFGKDVLMIEMDTPIAQLTKVDLQEVYTFTRSLDSAYHPCLPQMKIIDQESSKFFVCESIEGKPVLDLTEQTSIPLSAIRVLGWGLQLCDLLKHLYPMLSLSRWVKLNVAYARVGKNDMIVIDIVEYLTDLIDDMECMEHEWKRFPLQQDYYNPPEWFSSRMDNDVRASIYNLGAVLYDLLRGTLSGFPFVIEFPHPSLKTFNPSITAKLDYAIRKALELKPEHRWQTVAEFRQALEEALAEIKSN